MQNEMLQTVKNIATRGRGILAADESMSTIGKRFAAINVENTEENRRAYREMLFSTPGLGEYISGVILFEETLLQKDKHGTPFSEVLLKQHIIPGIKVDKGLINLANAQEEKVTQGLDGLPERLTEYKKQGAKFAKWRAVFNIDQIKPTRKAIRANSELLARYAAICQEQGIVPIVEPEVLMDGNHTLERCHEVTEEVLHHVFNALHRYQIILECMILKPSMVISGKECAKQASIEQVAYGTIQVLLRTVPAAVPTINFLSGGQSSELATANLNAMNHYYPNLPWNLSFSYGRALQDHALKIWQGKEANVLNAQQALYKRSKLNASAAMGTYSEKLEEAVA